MDETAHTGFRDRRIQPLCHLSGPDHGDSRPLRLLMRARNRRRCYEAASDGVGVSGPWTRRERYRRISTSSTQAFTTAPTTAKSIPATIQYKPPPAASRMLMDPINNMIVPSSRTAQRAGTA
jgi:hypothetical protein